MQSTCQNPPFFTPIDFDNSFRALNCPYYAREYFSLPIVNSLPKDSEHYSPSLSWFLMECARLTYRGEQLSYQPDDLRLIRRQIVEKYGLYERAAFTENGIHAVLWELDDYIICSFRGSVELKNWLFNMNGLPIQHNLSGAKVHRGFYQAWLIIRKQVLNALEKCSKPVLITGHSLGAALANLACVEYSAYATYTYGTPQIGNAAFAEYASAQRIYCIINNNDLVCRVPPKSLFKFQHIGTIRYIDQYSCIHKQALAHRLFSQATHYLPIDLSDHAAVNYVAHLQRAYIASQNLKD